MRRVGRSVSYESPVLRIARRKGILARTKDRSEDSSLVLTSVGLHSHAILHYALSPYNSSRLDVLLTR